MLYILSKTSIIYLRNVVFIATSHYKSNEGAMARRIKTNKADNNVEQALEKILESQLDENTDIFDEPDSIKFEELKHKIDNSTQIYDEDKYEEIVDYDLKEDQDFIKQLKAANDDKGLPSFSQIFSTRSSSKIYLNSFLLSFVWLCISAILGYNLFKKSSYTDLQNFLYSTTGITFLLVTIIPIALIWGFAKLMKNSKDLSTMIKSLVSTQENNLDNPLRPFNNLAQNISENVKNIDSGIQKTFERACEFETLVQGEVQNLERAYSENEEKIRKLIAMLANERYAILEHADRVKSTLQLTSNEISSELSGVTDKITINIETIADRLSDSLNEKTQSMLDNLKAISGSLTGELIEDIDEKSITYLEQLDVIFDKVKNGIETKTAENINIFSDKLSEIGDAANIIVNEFNCKFDDMDVVLNNRSQQSLENFEGQLKIFTNIFNAIPERLDIATKKALVECEKNLLALDDILSDQSKSAITSFISYFISIEEHTDKLTNLLDTRVSSINNSIKEHITELSTAIDSEKENILLLADKTQFTVSDKLEVMESNIEKLFDDKTKILEEKFNDSNVYLGKIINDESNNITISLRERVGNITEYLNNMESNFLEKLTYLEGDKEKQIEIIKNFNDNLNEQLQNGLNYLTQTVETYHQNIEITSHNLHGEINNSLSDMFNNQSNNIDGRIEKLREFLADKEAKFSAIFDTQMNFYGEKIEQSSDVLTNEFSTHLSILKDYTQNLYEAINQTENLQISLSQHLDSSLEKSIGELEFKASNIGENLKNTIQESSNLLTQESTNAQIHIDNINSNLSNSINIFSENFTKAQENILQGTQYITDNIKEKIVDINENIQNEAEHVTQKMIQASEYINSNFFQVSNDMEQKIQERSAFLNESSVQLYEQMDQQLNKVGNSINELKEYNEVHFIQQLDKLNNTTNAVYNAAMATNEAITNTKHQLVDQISDTATKVKEQFLSENNILLQTVDAKSNELTNFLNNFNNDINNNLLYITSQLSEVGQSIFNRAGDIINNVQNTESIINSTIDSFNEKSTNISAGLSQSLHQHVELLNNAANILDKAQNNFDNNIDNKQQALNILATTLANKTDDILNSIKYYENTIQNNLGDMNQYTKTSLDNFQYNLKESIDKFNDTSNILKATAQTISNELNNFNHKKDESYINRGSETIKHAINNQANALGNIANFMNPASSTSGLSLKSVAADIIKAVNPNALAAMWKNYRKNAINIQPLLLYNSEGLMLIAKIKAEYETNFNFKNAIDNYLNEFEQILKNANTQNDPNAIYNALQTSGGVVYTVLANITGRIS